MIGYDVKKLLLSFSIVLLFVGCSDKQEIKSFSSFDKKYEYCTNYIDDSSCSDIRSLVILYSDTYLRYKGVNTKICSTENYLNTNTCKNYYYSSEYKRDIKSLVSECKKDKTLPYCSYFSEIGEMIKVIKM